MRCMSCKAGDIDKVVLAEHHYPECGLDNVYLWNIKGYRCRKCDAIYPVLPDATLTCAAIISELLKKKGTFNDDEFLFIAKALGVRASLLRSLLVPILKFYG